MVSAVTGKLPGFRRIVSFNARKCARKVCFYKPHISGASKSEFNQIRIPHKLKKLYSVKVIKMSRLSIAYLFYGRFTGTFVFVKLHNFFVLRLARR